jgi:glyoxylase-like metal-dependent hydrolase (beta-lactamase superfamily II)
MILAEESQSIDANLALWHVFDPKAKAELFSTACRTDRGILFIDPIPLAETALKELLGEARPVGIVVTNANHWRASSELAKKLSIPIFAHADSGLMEKSPFEPLADGQMLFDSIRVIAIPGGAPGEVALHLPDKNGSLIVGDALIHFEPYGFTFLPAKYCLDHKLMRQSLRNLLPFAAERMFFAHGTPILSAAGRRLRDLLDHGD